MSFSFDPQPTKTIVVSIANSDDLSRDFGQIKNYQEVFIRQGYNQLKMLNK